MTWTSWRNAGAAAVVGIAAVVLVSTPAVGQTIDIGGHLGLYTPVGSLINAPGSVDGPLPIEKRLQIAPLIGANVVTWFSRRLGFAVGGAYAPSRVAVIEPGFVRDRDASVVLASARALFAITPMKLDPGAYSRGNAPWSYYVGVGGGLATRSGGVWAYSSGLTSPALVLSGGVQTLIGPRFVMRLELEDYISQAQFDAGAPGETPARMHQDFLVSFSMAFRAVRR
jgi:hypothetical protein